MTAKQKQPETPPTEEAVDGDPQDQGTDTSAETEASGDERTDASGRVLNPWEVDPPGGSTAAAESADESSADES